PHPCRAGIFASRLAVRIVAGSAGGISLHVPRSEIRPTMDRVKAAIFSALGEKIVDARVLDLFAGTGSLGIEALSRGCATATFVDNDADATDAIERNFVRAKLRGDVWRGDVFRFLEKRATAGGYDVIFADPPYVKKNGDRDFANDLLRCAPLAEALAPAGVFVLEKMPAQVIDWPAPWECVRLKKYGATEVAFLNAEA
ncbi:MAG: 16S rRNA (guanine(966)-N(2))-methyltransferase RsmD, partial [Verrucomicrobiota bacterium]|nr:16S rRNA (guanine(966)-N(2))-methyltransferase RsmD [Verrucomicrobiota bacterium]